jgi:urease accessory protein
VNSTVVEISARGEGASCVLQGELFVPRLVARHGRSVDVALVAGRAMLLPGDDVRLRITVGEGCTLRLVDIGGLVVYGRPDEVGDASQWHARIDLATGAHLVWESLPTVVTRAARLVRSLTVTLAPASSASLRETVVLGRVGEIGGRLTADTDIADAAGPILRETLDVRGDIGEPGILGAARVIDSVIAVGDHVAVADVPGATRLDFERGGAAVRYLGHAAHESPLTSHPARIAESAGEPVHAA